MGSINIWVGVVWLFVALIWLRRAMAHKARPSEPVSSFAQLQPTTENARRLGMWFCFVLYVMLGVLYLLKDTFERYLSQGR